MGDPSDTELVGQARRGDAAAAEALVRRYLRPAYAVALAVVRNTAEAEDVAQESLMVALQRIGQCRDPARFAPWLLLDGTCRAGPGGRPLACLPKDLPPPPPPQ